MTITEITFDPVLPVWALAALGTVLVGLLIFGLWRKAKGTALRFFAGLALLFAAMDPKLAEELRDPLTDIALLVVDDSASQSIDGRAALTAQAAASLTELAARLGETLDLRTVTVGSGGSVDANDGTRLVTAIESGLADIADDRVAGVMVITDGRAEDATGLANQTEKALQDRFAAPVHFLSTARDGEYDRRLALESAPTFGIVGEPVEIRLRVEDLGATPAGAPPARISLRIDGREVRRDTMAIGTPTTITAPLEKGGASVFEIVVETLDGELTPRNNRALFTVNGARDRLRVMLVSGEPHSGQRAWRNLLKADPAVDLVHFTILRPPTKLAGTPIQELSLIPFPTRELFMQKIDEFDLVIFDRFVRRGVLAPAYLNNVTAYVRRGGAVLIAAGPHFGGVNSLFRTPLAQIMPAEPTGGLIERLYRPALTDIGARHPVTGTLEGATLPEGWGRWMRQIEIAPRSGDVLMTGADDQPLLVVDRFGEGRVAMLASDTAWLWSRGYDGGGPLAEMLRRVAHWLMKEPQLEENALTAEVRGGEVSVLRRSLEDAPKSVTVTTPSGAPLEAPLAATAPGQWRATFEAREQGLYQMSDGTLTGTVAVGPAAPKEFENPVGTFDLLAPLAAATGGAQVLLRERGTPSLRRVGDTRRAYGPGWIGLRERGAYVVREARLTPLLPAWLALSIAAALLFGAWRVEGR